MSKKQNSDILKLAKGTGISLIGSVTGKLFLLLSHVIIARFLGAEAFGIFVLAIVVCKVAELLARLGLDTAAMRFVSVYRNNFPERLKGTLISSISIAFLNGVIVGVTLYLIAGFVSEKIFHQPQLKDIIQVLSFCVPLMASMMVVATSTRGFHTTKYSAYIKDIIQPLTNFTFVIVFIFFDAGIKGVVYAFVLSHVAALTGGIYFLIKKRFLDVKNMLRPKYDIRELISYSAPLMVSGFLGFWMAWTDTIMLGMMRTSAEVGVYRAAVQIPLLMAIILQASNSIYAPVIADLFSRGKMERLNQTLKTTTRWVGSLMLPVALVLIFSARQLMLIFGAEFVNPGATILIIFTGAQLINCATSGVGYMLTMTGRQNIDMLNSTGMVVLNIILNLFLIPRFGGIGAALATGISLSAINILRLVEVYVIYKIHPYDLYYLKIIAGAVATVVIVIFFKSIIEIESNILLVLAHFGIVGTVFTVFSFFTCLPDEDKDVFEAVKTRLCYFRK